MKRHINFIGIPKKGNTTTVGIFVKRGSKHEPNNIKGISHFIEHLCFKGTKKLSQLDIAQSIEKYGGDLNAFTDYDVTAYWAKISNRYKNLAFKILKEMVFNPIFPDKEIDKEREVIIQEMNMYEDDPKMYIDELVYLKMFKNVSGYHLPEIGTKESLKKINRNIIKKYYNENYNYPTIIAVGDVPKRYDVNGDKTPSTSMEMNSPIIYFEKRNDIKQANISISNIIKTNFPFTNQAFSAILLSTIYNDMSGRLFRTIREKNNLVYHIRFYNQSLSEGYIKWIVELALEKKNINKAHDLILKELNRPVSKKEIKLAITKFLGEMDMHLDDTRRIANIVINCEVDGFNYKDFIYNYKKNIIKVSKNINEFIKEMNFNRNFLIGIIPKK